MDFVKYLKEILSLKEAWEKEIYRLDAKADKGLIDQKELDKFRNSSYNKIYKKYCAKNIMKGNLCVSKPPQYCTKGMVIKVIEKNDKFVICKVKVKMRSMIYFFRLKFIKKKWLIDKIFWIDYEGKEVRDSF